MFTLCLSVCLLFLLVSVHSVAARVQLGSCRPPGCNAENYVGAPEISPPVVSCQFGVRMLVRVIGGGDVFEDEPVAGSCSHSLDSGLQTVWIDVDVLQVLKNDVNEAISDDEGKGNITAGDRLRITNGSVNFAFAEDLQVVGRCSSHHVFKRGGVYLISANPLFSSDSLWCPSTHYGCREKDEGPDPLEGPNPDDYSPRFQPDNASLGLDLCGETAFLTMDVCSFEFVVEDPSEADICAAQCECDNPVFAADTSWLSANTLSDGCNADESGGLHCKESNAPQGSSWQMGSSLVFAVVLLVCMFVL